MKKIKEAEMDVSRYKNYKEIDIPPIKNPLTKIPKVLKKNPANDNSWITKK